MKNKSKFPRQNRVKQQVRKGMVENLNKGNTYGKGCSSFHLTKSDLHNSHSNPNRYDKITNKKWLKVLDD